MGHLRTLPVGPDGRHRVMLSPFGARTGRNQPSGKYILSQSKWARAFIKPRPGYSIAELDYKNEEFRIAAALSKDYNMLRASEIGPYVVFMRETGLAPADATKESHPILYKRCKESVLRIQYTMGADALAFNIQQPKIYAEELLKLHHRLYPDNWRWNDGVLNYALLHRSLQTALGWTTSYTHDQI